MRCLLYAIRRWPRQSGGFHELEHAPALPCSEAALLRPARTSIASSAWAATSSSTIPDRRRLAPWLGTNSRRRLRRRPALNRDRGEPHGPAPPTPPCIRVRTRRFGGLIGLLGTREGRPSAASEALGNARVRAGLLLSRQGPCGLPAVCAARSRPTPRRRSSANLVRPRFHCFQGTARSRRLIHSSSPRNTWSFAEAEVGAPSFEIARQFFDDLREAAAAGSARQFPHSRFEPGHRLRRQASLDGCPDVKLKPRNFRIRGAATALFALLTLSFNLWRGTA